MKKFFLFLLFVAAAGCAAFVGHKASLRDMGFTDTIATPKPANDLNTVSAKEMTPEPDTTSNSPTSSAAPDSGLKTTSITFSASGDDLIHSTIYNQAKARGKGKYDFSYCYKSVKKFFKAQDLNWINQETLVTDAIPASTYPQFCSPGAVAKALYKAKFRVFNISTNHTYDKRAQGLSATMKFWKKKMPNDVLATGLVKKGVYNKIPIKKIKGVKIAFLSYTYGTNGLPTPSSSSYRVIFLNETKIIKKQIKLARKKADIVVVSAHWGTEDRHEITAAQKKLAKKFTKWGADLIIGTHPHVVQDASWIKAGGRKAFCTYSLGNFISGQKKPDNLIGATLSLTFKVKTGADGKKKLTIKNPKLIPTVTEYRKGQKNIHVVWLKDYKKKQANTHGVRYMGGKKFGYDYIFSTLKKTIRSKYLDLPKKK